MPPTVAPGPRSNRKRNAPGDCLERFCESKCNEGGVVVVEVCVCGGVPFALCINIPLHGGWWCFMYFVLLFFCDLFHLCSSHLKLINFLTYADLLRPLSKDKFVHGIPFQDAIVSFAPILYNQPSMTRKISSGRSMQSRGPVQLPIKYNLWGQWSPKLNLSHARLKGAFFYKTN